MAKISLPNQANTLTLLELNTLISDADVSADETTTSIGALINGATDKATPVDADYVGLMDSAVSSVLKKLSWFNVKETLKTYFDTLYVSSVSAWITNYVYTTSGITVGNGTKAFRYVQIGKVVHFSLEFVLGSTSVVTGNPTFTLPIAVATNGFSIATAYAQDASAGTYTSIIYMIQGGTISSLSPNTNSTSPFTWASGDRIRITGTYEVA